MAESCNTCRFAYGPVPDLPDQGQYWCRRYPPQRHHPEWHSGFPLVPRTGQWCGEYKNGAPTPVETP